MESCLTGIPSANRLSNSTTTDFSLYIYREDEIHTIACTCLTCAAVWNTTALQVLRAGGDVTGFSWLRNTLLCSFPLLLSRSPPPFPLFGLFLVFVFFGFLLGLAVQGGQGALALGPIEAGVSEGREAQGWYGQHCGPREDWWLAQSLCYSGLLALTVPAIVAGVVTNVGEWVEGPVDVK